MKQRKRKIVIGKEKGTKMFISVVGKIALWPHGLGERGVQCEVRKTAAPENPQQPCACQRWLGDSGRRMKHALCPSRPCPRSLLFAELLQAPVIPGKRSADNLCRRRTRRWPAERSAGRSRKPGAGRPARDEDAAFGLVRDTVAEKGRSHRGRRAGTEHAARACSPQLCRKTGAALPRG